MYDIHFGPALHQPYINSPTWFKMIIAAITINGPMLDSPKCNKSFVSAVTLWSEKFNFQYVDSACQTDAYKNTMEHSDSICPDLFADAVDTSIDILSALGLSKCQEDS